MLEHMTIFTCVSIHVCNMAVLKLFRCFIIILKRNLRKYVMLITFKYGLQSSQKLNLKFSSCYSNYL